MIRTPGCLLYTSYKVVIGGGIINEFAKSHHMAIINVPYDESDILSAVHLAQHNLKAIEERQEQTEILHTIQDHISEGILSLEPNGKIQTANRSASTFPVSYTHLISTTVIPPSSSPM